MELQEDYYIIGMHVFWWLFWVSVVSFTFLYEPVSKRIIYKNTPLDILKRHYATGNMTTEEYHEREKVLKGK